MGKKGSPIALKSLLYSLSDIIRFRDNFTQELELASKGRKASLSFIENPIPQKALAKKGEKFQVFVIGGTNFRTAEVLETASEPRIMSISKGKVPNFYDKKGFLSFIKNNLKSQVKTISFNFAYGLKPIIKGGIIDGRLLGASKESPFQRLAGEVIGESLEGELKKYGRTVSVSVANDTVCLMLSGSDKDSIKKTVAGIVGTGVNFAIAENGKIINLETGSFDKFTQTKTGQEIDQDSQRPGRSLLEKEISGAYLYRHFNILSKKYGLKYDLQNTEELSKQAQKDSFVGELARKLLERSASLTAMQIAGIYKFKGQNTLVIVMEGSLFWNGWSYKNLVEEYLGKLGIPKGKIEFRKVENSDILGAIKLVTY